jgi:hypothetical protein
MDTARIPSSAHVTQGLVEPDATSTRKSQNATTATSREHASPRRFAAVNRGGEETNAIPFPPRARRTVLFHMGTVMSRSVCALMGIAGTTVKPRKISKTVSRVGVMGLVLAGGACVIQGTQERFVRRRKLVRKVNLNN